MISEVSMEVVYINIYIYIYLYMSISKLMLLNLFFFFFPMQTVSAIQMQLKCCSMKTLHVSWTPFPCASLRNATDNT